MDADLLSATQKLAIAAEIGLSETAFISASDQATIKLEFFTPTRQIAHCGHATVASFALLRQQGKLAEGLFSKQTIDGNRQIWIAGESIFMEQQAPSYRLLDSNTAAYQQALAALHLNHTHLLTTAAPHLASTGGPFLLIGVQNANTLAAIKADFAAINTLSEQLDVVGFYVFSLQTSNSQRQATTRMFAPRYGINEESATGMAAGPLACFLYDHLGSKQSVLQIEQGRLMSQASPSLIHVQLELTQGQINRLKVGGTASVKSRVNITL